MPVGYVNRHRLAGVAVQRKIIEHEQEVSGDGVKKQRYDEPMANGHLSKIEGKLREVLVAYHIGPRGWKQRAVFSLGIMATAGLVLIPPAPSHDGPDIQISLQTQAQADVAAEGVDPGIAPVSSKESQQAIEEKDPTAPARAGQALDPHAASKATPFVEVGAMTSNPGEGKDAFLVRVAQTMDVFTRTTEHEICGVIMVSDNNDAYRVRLTTNRSHIACTMVVFAEPGFSRLGPDIHSHPFNTGDIRANARDIVYRKDFSCGQKMTIFDHRFSTVDFNHGAGYLVTRGQLLYQHGVEWPIRQLAVFDRIDEPEALEIGGGLDPEISEELAAAAWENEDREGVPATACPADDEEAVVEEGPVEKSAAPGKTSKISASNEDIAAPPRRRTSPR